MRHFRNPAYAPESLERKLSPSGFIAIPVAAEVSQVNGQGGASSPQDTSADAADLDGGGLLICTAGEPRPSQPGDPEPADPKNPGDGSETDPGDGDGSPPVLPTSTPSGPNLPPAP